MTEADSRMCSVKKKFLKICKIHRLRSTTLFKKRLLHNRFPVNVAKSLRTSVLQNISCVSIMEAVILTSVKSVRNRDKIQALSKKKEDNNLVFYFEKNTCQSLSVHHLERRYVQLNNYCKNNTKNQNRLNRQVVQVVLINLMQAW